MHLVMAHLLPIHVMVKALIILPVIGQSRYNFHHMEKGINVKVLILQRNHLIHDLLKVLL